MTRAPSVVLRFLALALGLIVICYTTALSLMLDSHPVQLPPERIQPIASHSDEPIQPSVKSAFGQGLEKRFVLNESDLNKVCDSGLKRRKMKGECQIMLSGETLEANASLKLPLSFWPLYLNVHLKATDHESGAQLLHLRIGHLSLDPPWSGYFVAAALHFPPLRRYGLLVDELLKEVRIVESRLVIRVKWDRELLTEIRGLLTDVADKDRMRAYYERLVDVLDDGTNTRFISLGNLTQPLFALAFDRSRREGNPIEENRALIVVLSAYVNGKDLSRVVNSSAHPLRRNVLLNRRMDTAKHFLAAAVLAMSGQGTLVEMIGLVKELHDTHDGSGFSFNDLAADQAGAFFGKGAIASVLMARHFQTVLRQSNQESLFIPILRDLPESMKSAEFESRFSAVGSPEYTDMRTEIDNRINALPLYQLETR